MKSKRNIFLHFIICVLTVSSVIIPQVSKGQVHNDTIKADSISRDSVILAWLKDLNEEGVTVVNDTVIISPEAKKLLNSEQYRQIMYPKKYSWDKVVEFIQKQELKKAFWFLINLYMTDEKNRELVVKSLLAYDRLFKMDKILTNTFHTYILTDPEIGAIVDGKPTVTAPQVMDKKLNALKEILFYLDKYKPKD